MNGTGAIERLEAAACEQVMRDEHLVAVVAQDVLSLVRAYRELEKDNELAWKEVASNAGV